MAILYLEDWDHYPTAVPDIPGLETRHGVLAGTRNQSWLDQAYKFRDMGIENWYFCLTLYNPQLSGLDPHSDELTEEQMSLMLLELEHNPWYALREVLRVPAKSGGGHGPLGANRGNIALFWSVFNSFVTYLQQIRQTGKSLNTRMIIVAWHMFWAYGSQHILFTKSDLRKEEIREYKDIRAALPKWMWETHFKDTDNQHEFTNFARGNRTKTYIPQGDPEAANNVGRGQSPTIITSDEPPFLPYASTSIPALIAAGTQTFTEAERKGAMHFLLFTTTAGDLSTESGQYVYNKIKKMAMPFGEFLYDAKNRAEAIKIILANSQDKVVPRVDISFNHRQLGYTDEWLRAAINRASARLDQIKRDYLSQWTFGSADNPIPEKLLNKIRNWINNEIIERVDPKRHYRIRFHVPYEEALKRQSAMGLDTSNAVGRDAITGVAIAVDTTETLFAFMVNETFLEHFGDWLIEFMVLFSNLTLVPENKSSWAGIGDKLILQLPLKGVDPGRRIYSRVVDRAEDSERDRKVYREYCQGNPSERKYASFRSDFGFNTNADLRTELYSDVLRAATNQAATLIRDPILVDELSSLVMRRGRIDHQASGHDDHVMSWLFANWFLRYARNLSHYGIDPRTVLSRLKFANNDQTAEEVAKITREEKLRLNVEILEDKLERARSSVEVQYYQARLRSAKSELKDRSETDSVGSLDRAALEAKDQRQEIARTRHAGPVFSGKSVFNGFKPTFRR